MDQPGMRHWDRCGAQPVLALHCSLAEGRAFAALAGHLQGIRLSAIDLPGHGQAKDWDGAADLHALATDMAQDAILALGQGGPVDLIGHSFGGTVALRLAVQAPHLVRSLTLIEPVLFAAARGTAAWTGFAAAHQLFREALASGNRTAAATRFLADWGTGGRFTDMPAQMQIYIRDRIHLISAVDAVLNDDCAGILAPGRLEKVAAPALITEGENSPPVIAEINAALMRRLPNARRLVVPGAGHMLPVTHPAELAGAVMEMWRRMAAS